MAKSKIETLKEEPVISAEDAAIVKQLDDHWFRITEATIKDGFCNYSYEITKGVGLGRTHKVDGKVSGNIIDDDMRTAFSKFNVHMAAIGDIFKHSGIEIKDIDKEHGNAITGLFNVTGFKIIGSSDNETIQLFGTYYVSVGSRFDLDSPKIPLDSASSYHWYKQLKPVANKARLEVLLYDNGKYTKAEPEEEEDSKKVKQGKMSFNKTESQTDEVEGDDDFENAKV